MQWSTTAKQGNRPHEVFVHLLGLVVTKFSPRTAARTGSLRVGSANAILERKLSINLFDFLFDKNALSPCSLKGNQKMDGLEELDGINR